LIKKIIHNQKIRAVYGNHNTLPQRVMIRNIPPTCTRDYLLTILNVTCGDVEKLVMKDDDDSKKTSSSGWAFVDFKKVTSATKAVSTLNGFRIKKNEIAVDFVIPRDEFERTKKLWSAQQQSRPLYQYKKNENKSNVEQAMPSDNNTINNTNNQNIDEKNDDNMKKKNDDNMKKKNNVNKK